MWSDKKRILGMPISFTRYSLSEDRLFISTGCWTITDNEIALYRVRDIQVSRTLMQRLFGVGTVTIISSDKSHPALELKNIKNPINVKELIYKQSEIVKAKRGVRFGEITTDSDDLYEN